MDFKRIVVKIGSSSLSSKNAKLNFTKIDDLTRQLVDLKTRAEM